jgi:hypothetical protein
MVSFLLIIFQASNGESFRFLPSPLEVLNSGASKPIRILKHLNDQDLVRTIKWYPLEDTHSAPISIKSLEQGPR